MAQAPSPSTVLCSICWDEASETCGRSIVRLQCSHLFHLDCIGSAFNVSGIMQCPNCREIENGVWRRFENTNNDQDMDQEADEDQQHVVQTQYLGDRWCPIHGRIAESPIVESADLDIAEIEIPAIFPGDHHHHGPPVITEISTSQIFIHRTNQVPPATIAPTCNHVIGVNRTFASSGIQGAPQGYSGAGLPNVGLGAYDVILEQGRQPNVFHGWLPEAQIPLPHQHAIYQNYPEPPFLVHHHVEEEVHAPPYEYFPEDMDFY